MSNCKCGKVLLKGEKKCERCRNKNKESLKKVGGSVLALVLTVGSIATSIGLNGKNKK